MFLTGQFIKNFPDLVLSIINQGHEVANHSFSHPHLTQMATNGKTDLLEKVNRNFIQKQLFQTDSVFKLLTGKKMKP